MVFVADHLFDSRKFPGLTVVDNYSWQCLAIGIGQGIKGEQVIAVMENLKHEQGSVPERIKIDNSSEFFRHEQTLFLDCAIIRNLTFLESYELPFINSIKSFKSRQMRFDN